MGKGLRVGKIVRFRNARRQRRSRKPSSSGFLGFLLLAIVGGAAAGYLGGDLFSGSGNQSVVKASPTGSNSALVGRASVIDGDTIDIHGERIRFNGIDAPESSQLCKDGGGHNYRCGASAANALADFLAASSPTTCEFVEWDQYGRFVGNCSRADGASVQSWLVRNGHAMDWPRYSNGAFADDQRAARAEKLGIWQGEFQPPWSWRAARRGGGSTSIVPLMSTSGRGGECNIKGNISSKGERIYHIPGQQHYDRTRISERKGERWFCSEEEARAAGWRRARR